MVNETCTERVTHLLKERIMAGHYKPGKRLLYSSIAEELGVSISPVREAFLLLEKQGLLQIVPRKGVYIRTLDQRDIYEYTHIRYSLESLAVEMICANGLSSEQVEKFKAINKQIYALFLAHDIVNAVNQDVIFHEHLIECSGLQRLTELWQKVPLCNPINNMNMSENNKSRVFDGLVVYDSHQAIINALQERNAAEAKQHLKDNIFVQY